jgi:cysteinyl-tRNA synthetase
MLQIYNTLTRTKELFKPIEPGKVGIYVCGMTVYDFCHIGHGRIFVVFDMVVRFLRYLGYEVVYVRNITDIDDKIINRANENKENTTELTERFITAMHEDEQALGVLAPDRVPRATQHIAAILAMIDTLMTKGYAYQASNGDVYYDTKKFPTYGDLAGQDLEKLRAGIRVDVVEAKHDAFDFVLWKLAKPGEPKWHAKWGDGRPGWHIECSAMSNELLGKHFDIHGGGLDLQFPHHQNEIAQSEAANDCKFVNTWMHVGYVTIDKEKMSKSLGNFFTIREVLKNYDPEVIRYFMLASHYRSPISYSLQNLTNASGALERLYGALRGLPEVQEMDTDNFEQKYLQAMTDDFNTPVALAVLFDIVREINRCKEEGKISQAGSLAVLLKRLAMTLGLLQNDPEKFLQGRINSQEVNEIERLINARNQARLAKDWAEADRIRGQLQLLGVAIEDGPQGTTWRKEVLFES